MQTARERVENFFDPGTFQEFGIHAAHQCVNFGMQEVKLPTDGVVTGVGSVDGRPVAVYSQDFTVGGGALGAIHAKKICELMDFAHENGMPVIGINDYQHWPELAGATGDARRVAAALRSQGFDEVLELYDGEATRSAVLRLLSRDLATTVGDEDLVVIYFAGHGHTETLPSGEKRGYVIPVDGTTDGVFSTAISMQELRKLADRLSAKHVYYAMDSCYSGLGFTRGISVVRKSSSDYIGKVTAMRAVQMVTAGMEGEEAIEQDGAGLFTSSFLRALEGAADYDDDGWVTASEIGLFVRPDVTSRSKARQTPQFGTVEGQGEVVFRVRD